MSIFICLVTCPSQEVGATLAKLLVEQRLAGCVQVLPPMQSVYRWQGEVRTEEECLLIIKSSLERKDELQKAINDNHPYDVPEFVVVPVTDASPEYSAWLLGSVSRTST